jgi:hypothetical protein
MNKQLTEKELEIETNKLYMKASANAEKLYIDLQHAPNSEIRLRLEAIKKLKLQWLPQVQSPDYHRVNFGLDLKIFFLESLLEINRF